MQRDPVLAEPIRSTHNPLVQRVRSALRGLERGWLVLEGDRLVDEALRQRLEPEFVLVAAGRADRARELAARGVNVRLLEESLFESLSALQTSPGCLALLREPSRLGAEALPDGASALVVVAAGMQDPGNLGALARTAEAAGAELIAVVAGGCRPWNGKALRGSMGSLLRLPVIEFDSAADALRALEERGYRSVFARTQGGGDPEDFRWDGRIALWLTSEAGRLPVEIEQLAREAPGVTIPMAGEAESLNVTAAAAVILFAVRRARTRSRS